MGKQFICDGTKYELAGPKDDVIGLPIQIFDLPDAITVDGIELLKRPAFHVSLVCPGKIAERYPITDPDFIQNVVKDFCKFLTHTSIDFVEFTGEYCFVTEGERKTVVAMCEIVGLKEFFMEMSEKYEKEIEYPPTHVTLYTLGGGPGIFLTTSDDINRLTKVIEKPFATKI